MGYFLIYSKLRTFQVCHRKLSGGYARDPGGHLLTQAMKEANTTAMRPGDEVLYSRADPSGVQRTGLCNGKTWCRARDTATQLLDAAMLCPVLHPG